MFLSSLRHLISPRLAGRDVMFLSLSDGGLSFGESAVLQMLAA